MSELNVIVSYLHIFVLRCSQDFSDQVLMVEPTAECFCFICFRHPLTVTSLDGLEVL